MVKECCVTGHRVLLTKQIDYVKRELRKQIQNAINDGYTHFISGMAEGTDLLFAELVIETKKDNPTIRLEAALPYRKRAETKNNDFHRIFEQCDSFIVLSENYSNACYKARNKYMVNQAERIIAVYDGRNSGGTAFTIQYAKDNGKELFIVPVDSLEAGIC